MTTTDNELTRADIAAIATTADKATIIPIAAKLDSTFGMDILRDWAAGKDLEEWRVLLTDILEEVAVMEAA